jgi:hypothetical protein
VSLILEQTKGWLLRHVHQPGSTPRGAMVQLLRVVVQQQQQQQHEQQEQCSLVELSDGLYVVRGLVMPCAMRELLDDDSELSLHKLVGALLALDAFRVHSTARFDSLGLVITRFSVAGGEGSAPFKADELRELNRHPQVLSLLNRCALLQSDDALRVSSVGPDHGTPGDAMRALLDATFSVDDAAAPRSRDAGIDARLLHWPRLQVPADADALHRSVPGFLRSEPSPAAALFSNDFGATPFVPAGAVAVDSASGDSNNALGALDLAGADFGGFDDVYDAATDDDVASSVPQYAPPVLRESQSEVLELASGHVAAAQALVPVSQMDEEDATASIPAGATGNGEEPSTDGIVMPAELDFTERLADAPTRGNNDDSESSPCPPTPPRTGAIKKARTSAKMKPLALPEQEQQQPPPPPPPTTLVESPKSVEAPDLLDVLFARQEAAAKLAAAAASVVVATSESEMPPPPLPLKRTTPKRAPATQSEPASAAVDADDSTSMSRAQRRRDLLSPQSLASTETSSSATRAPTQGSVQSSESPLQKSGTVATMSPGDHKRVEPDDDAPRGSASSAAPTVNAGLALKALAWLRQQRRDATPLRHGARQSAAETPGVHPRPAKVTTKHTPIPESQEGDDDDDDSEEAEEAEDDATRDLQSERSKSHVRSTPDDVIMPEQVDTAATPTLPKQSGAAPPSDETVPVAAVAVTAPATVVDAGTADTAGVVASTPTHAGKMVASSLSPDGGAVEAAAAAATTTMTTIIVAPVEEMTSPPGVQQRLPAQPSVLPQDVANSSPSLDVAPGNAVLERYEDDDEHRVGQKRARAMGFVPFVSLEKYVAQRRVELGLAAAGVRVLAYPLAGYLFWPAMIDNDSAQIGLVPCSALTNVVVDNTPPSEEDEDDENDDPVVFSGPKVERSKRRKRKPRRAAADNSDEPEVVVVERKRPDVVVLEECNDDADAVRQVLSRRTKADDAAADVDEPAMRPSDSPPRRKRARVILSASSPLTDSNVATRSSSVAAGQRTLTQLWKGDVGDESASEDIVVMLSQSDDAAPANGSDGADGAGDETEDDGTTLSSSLLDDSSMVEADDEDEIEDERETQSAPWLERSKPRAGGFDYVSGVGRAANAPLSSVPTRFAAVFPKPRPRTYSRANN